MSNEEAKRLVTEVSKTKSKAREREWAAPVNAVTEAMIGWRRSNVPMVPVVLPVRPALDWTFGTLDPWNNSADSFWRLELFDFAQPPNACSTTATLIFSSDCQRSNQFEVERIGFARTQAWPKFPAKVSYTFRALRVPQAGRWKSADPEKGHWSFLGNYSRLTPFSLIDVEPLNRVQSLTSWTLRRCSGRTGSAQRLNGLNVLNEVGFGHLEPLEPLKPLEPTPIGTAGTFGINFGSDG
jgi:hypothetical protein